MSNWYSDIIVSTIVPGERVLLRRVTTAPYITIRAPDMNPGPEFEALKAWRDENEAEFVDVVPPGNQYWGTWANGQLVLEANDETYSPEFGFLFDGVPGLVLAEVLYFGPMVPENAIDPVAAALARVQFQKQGRIGAALAGLRPATRHVTGVAVYHVASGERFEEPLE